jgi:hypothetical protein
MRILYDSQQLKYKTPFGTLTPSEKCTLTMYVPSTVQATMVSCIITRDGGSHAMDVDLPFKEHQGPYDVFQGSFNIYEVGEYKVVYSVTDYVGNVASAEYTLTIVENTKPLILDNIVLPKAFVNNLAYELPQVCAFDYTGGIENEIKPTISATIDGKAQNVVGTIVTPTAENDGDLMTVTYKYVNGNGVETVWNKDVPVINVKTQVGAIDQTKYFTSNGFAVESLSDSISLTTSDGNAEATFVRPVQARNLVLGVGMK